MVVGSYRELTAWQKAMDLVEVVYTTTRSWPKEELYGLTSQVRRAVVSVASNIAEGQGRNAPKEFLHHLRIAHGSLCEVETQLLVAQRLDYLNSDTAKRLLTDIAEVARLINGLIRHITGKLVTDH